jgi:alpha-tubulin suppressor-like RCC1 family protein
MNLRLLCAGSLAVSIIGCGAGGTGDYMQQPSQIGASRPNKAFAEIVTVDQPEVVLFSGKFSDYSITKAPQGYQVIDKVGSGGTMMIQSAKRLQFSDYSVSLDLTGTAAQVYRLYQAAFDRTPDLAGLGFHISAIDGSGINSTQVAQGFINSAEFQQKYGNTDNMSFVTLLYNNILHRAPDSAGVAYWKSLLDSNTISRAQTLQGFSESSENVTIVASRIENGITYAPYPIAGKGAVRERSAGKVTWGENRAVGILLQDARGIEVPTGHLTCVSSNEENFSIARDCSSAVGRKLGAYQVAVSGDGVSASLTLQVIPAKKPFDTSGMSNSGGDFSAVVSPNGNVLMWGSNDNGVLGQGINSSSLSYSSLPLFVKDRSGKGILKNVVAASTGSKNVMALTEEGTVLQWGSGASLPINVPNSSGTADLSNIVQVSLGGEENVAALTDTGMVLSWGYYTGQGTSAAKRFPDYVLDPDGKSLLSGIVAVSTGNSFALALGSNGKVYSWGGNTTLPRTIKRASDGAELTGIVKITAGYNFGFALTSGGQVYTWGDNAWGQLGQNVVYGDYPRAVMVKGVDGAEVLSDVVMISAGYAHTLALDSNGRVLSWGNGTGGKLGEGANGTRKSPYVPSYVVGTDSTGKLSSIVAISAGVDHSMALASDGTVSMWGEGNAGALGQGGTSLSGRRFPVPLKDATGTGILNLSPVSLTYPLRQGSH